MSKIILSCIDQELEILESNSIASGGVNEVFVVFNFCSRWNGFVKTAVFYQSKDDVYHQILQDDSCFIPWEVLSKSGTVYIGVFGTLNGVTRTSSFVKVKVKEGADTRSIKEPTPDVYEQLMSRLIGVHIGAKAPKEDYITMWVNPEGEPDFEHSETPWMASIRGEKGEKGDTGNSGYTGAADELEVVNNLNGGDTAALSAEMGKVLDRAMKTMSLITIPLTNNNPGYFMASNGVDLSASSGYTTTDYIDVANYSEVYVTARMGQIHGAVAGYDDSKNFTSWLLSRGNYTNTKVTIPKGVRFIRVNSNSGLEVSYPEFTSTFTIHANKIEKVNEEISTIKGDMYNAIYTPMDKGEITHGWLLNTGEINTYNSTTDYFVTDYMEVTEGETYYIDATKNAAGITVGAFDANKNYMTTLLALGEYEKEPITIPTGVKYIRVSSKNNPTVSTVSYSPKVIDVESSIEQIRSDVYTAYKEIPYNEDELYNGFLAANGVDLTSYGGFCATPFIDVREYPEVYVTTKTSNSGVGAVFLYDEDKNYMSKLGTGAYENEPVKAAYIRMNGQGTIPKVYYKGVGTEASKKKIAKNVNWVGMSIWWYDGKTLAEGFGGKEMCKGYQTLLKECFKFDSDVGYCYSGNSLGATSASDENSIMLKADTWAKSDNAIWTLDTITNDFKRNIPIGSDLNYLEADGPTTYYGALRAFADKVKELSGNPIVIVSNSLRRNNSGYTSTSANSKGHTLEDYEQALAYVAMKEGWYFVDQFRLSGLSENLVTTATLDGLHPNNFGFRLAVIPWYTMFNMIHDKLI